MLPKGSRPGNHTTGCRRGRAKLSAEITILIAEHNPAVSQDLQQIIGLENDLRVVAEAHDGQEALAQVLKQAPAVAVLDIDMDRMDAFEVVRAIRQQRLPVGFVLLTVHKDEDLLKEAMNIGVLGYIIKDSAVADIVEGIRAAAAGRLFVSSSIAVYLSHSSKVSN